MRSFRAGGEGELGLMRQIDGKQKQKTRDWGLWKSEFHADWVRSRQSSAQEASSRAELVGDS